MIIRLDKSKIKFTQMPNDIIERKDMSWEAKGLLSYMLSKPDDWKFYIDDIVKHGNCGEKKIKSIIKELKEFGYLEIKQERGVEGKFGNYIWTLNESPKVPKGMFGETIEESLPKIEEIPQIKDSDRKSQNGKAAAVASPRRVSACRAVIT